jgi:multidrug transporter EmrE-like cation transporter
VAVGVPNYYSSYLLVIALGKLPAMLVFPAFSIGTILLVTVCSLWFFRERLTKRQAVGLALIGAALALLNL